MPVDQRRCRRCKRKRLEDEPTEVMQYKTCAKCRIIERNKKNSRRPLADETMLYGLKQFQEQRASDNFMEEEGLLDDEFFRRFQNKVFNYDAEIREVLSNPNYAPPVLALGSRYTFKSTPNIKKTYQKKKKIPLTMNVNSSVQSNMSRMQQAQNVTASTVQSNVLTHGEEYGMLAELAKLGNSGEETREIDGVDPYAFTNVYSSFQLFLTAVLEKREHGENIHNLVYLKEFDRGVVDMLSNGPTTLHDAGGSVEKQTKLNLHHNIKSLYIDPIAALTQVEYNQVHTNVQDLKNSITIRGYHNFVQPQSAPQGAATVANAKAIKNSSIYFTYDRAYNVLIIKVNHHTFKPSTNSYSPEIKQKIHELVRPVVEYNVYTAGLVYDKLLEWAGTTDPKTQLFIRGLTREDFVSDFINFEQVFRVDGREDDEEEEERFEEDENDEAEIDDGEDDEGEDEEVDDENDDDDLNSEDELEDESVLAAAAAAVEATAPAGVAESLTQDTTLSESLDFKQPSVEALDPVLKPEN